MFKKIALVLALVCVLTFAFVGCGETTDLTELEDRLAALESSKMELQNKLDALESSKTELQNKLDALDGEKTELEKTIEANKAALQDQIDALENEKADLDSQLEELYARTTIFYDWDNPILVTTDELNEAFDAGYDVYMNLYYNKVIQITGIVYGRLVSPAGLAIISDGSSRVWICRSFSTYTGSVIEGQTITVKGVGGGGFQSQGNVREMQLCRIV